MGRLVKILRFTKWFRFPEVNRIAAKSNANEQKGICCLRKQTSKQTNTLMSHEAMNYLVCSKSPDHVKT